MSSRLIIVSLLLVNVCTTFAQDVYVSGAPSGIVQSRLFGTTSASEITALALLPNGNVVLAGFTTDASLQARAPGLWQSKASSTESFVAICSPRLDSIKSWTFFGGSQFDRITAIAVNQFGDIAVVGTTNSPDLPTTTGAYNQVHGGVDDGFLAVLSADLDSLRYCTYIGGTGNDAAHGIACDGLGNFIVVGQTGSRTTFRTMNAYAGTYYGGAADAFLVKFNQRGSVVFATYFGSVGTDVFRAVTVAEDGTILATGSTSSETFETWPRKLTPWDPTTARPFDPVFNGGISDAVVVGFSSDGSRLVFSSFLGGIESETGLGITTTATGRIAVVGETNSSNFPTQANSDSYKGHRDIFVAFVRPDGQQLLSSRLFGGMQDDVPCFISTVTNDQVLVVGWSASSDIVPEAEGSNRFLQGEADVLVLRVASTDVLYRGRFGWHASDRAIAAVMDNEGDLYLAGSTSSVDIGKSESTKPAASYESPFVSRFVFGAVELSNPRGGDRWCQGTPVTLSWQARNMKSTDDYTIQLAEPGKNNWETVVPPQTGLRATWNPMTNLSGSTFDFRLLSRRGHEVRTLDPVVIRVPASVSLSPTSLSQCRGTTVLLTVTAAGTDLQFQWRKNGRAIVGATSPQLAIEVLDDDAAGRYDVQVVSSCGAPVTSAPAQVDVTPSTVLMLEPHDRSIVRGSTLRLSAQASGADLQYQWYHEGQALESQTTSTLEIPSVTEAHRGRYHATIAGACGTVTTRTAFVAIDGATSVHDSHTQTPVLWRSAHPVSTHISLSVAGLYTSATIIDALGARVVDATVGNLAEGTDVSASVSALASGTYTVLLVGHSGVRSIPFVIQR